jgi:hypothetical protein
MATFDPKSVSPIEWAGVGAGAAAFIFSFFPAVSYDAYVYSVSFSSWSFGPTLLAVLLLIGAAVVVLLPHLGIKVPSVALIWLGASGLATLLVLIEWLSFGSDAGIGFFLLLLTALASAGAATMTFLATRKTIA